MIATIITYMIQPNVKGIIEGIGNDLPEQVQEAKGIKKVGAYIVHNGFLVPFQMFMLAFIPIPFLYLVNIISTVTLPGILFGIALQIQIEKGLGIIIATIPHYLVEVFAFCLFAAILFELNQTVREKIRSILKRDATGPSLIKRGLETIKMYAVFVLPLIMIAAFVETYLADLIFSLFE